MGWLDVNRPETLELPMLLKGSAIASSVQHLGLPIAELHSRCGPEVQQASAGSERTEV